MRPLYAHCHVTSSTRTRTAHFSLSKKIGGRRPYLDQVADCRSARSSAPRWHENNASRRALLSAHYDNQSAPLERELESPHCAQEEHLRADELLLPAKDSSVIFRAAMPLARQALRRQSISSLPSSVFTRCISVRLGVLCEVAAACQQH